jgi:RNA polymerase sigma-70 factor (ECF subfamily)
MDARMTLTDLYEEYETKLRRYAARLAQDPHWADDLVQDTFVRAMGHLDLLRVLKPYQQRAWLYRTLKNLFLDQLASQQRQEALVDDLGREAATFDRLHDDLLSPNPFDLVPVRYRELVEKRYALDMTSQEIGTELGIPAATVRSRLHLALKETRSRLGQDTSEDSP